MFSDVFPSRSTSYIRVVEPARGAETLADAMAWSTWRILNGLTGELTCELEAKDPTISQLKKSIEKEINIHPARQEEYVI